MRLANKRRPFVARIKPSSRSEGLCSSPAWGCLISGDVTGDVTLFQESGCCALHACVRPCLRPPTDSGGLWRLRLEEGPLEVTRPCTRTCNIHRKMLSNYYYCRRRGRGHSPYLGLSRGGIVICRLNSGGVRGNACSPRGPGQALCRGARLALSFGVPPPHSGRRQLRSKLCVPQKELAISAGRSLQ